MRHRVKGKKLSRNSGQRKSLRQNLIISLFEHGRIRTTLAKAQFMRGQAERLITIAKRGYKRKESSGQQSDLVHAQRVAASRLYNRRDVVQRLFDHIAPHFMEREGGYTRIIKIGGRHGDQAEMVILELVDYKDLPAPTMLTEARTAQSS
ncbi:MAG: 50S ribosomal protein L17 [Phototrophicaceae bacterium]|jgi:large subunit ribosomal protein L17